MSDEPTTDRPRASARKKLFASGPIRGITNEDEEIMCRILVAIVEASRADGRKRVDLEYVLDLADVVLLNRERVMRLVDALGKAGAIYHCAYAKQVRLSEGKSSERRAKEAVAALALWTKGKRKIGHRRPL